MPKYNIYDPEPITEKDLEQMKQVTDKIKEVTEDMAAMLYIHGVWCRGKRGRCYAFGVDSCYTCPHYDGRGVNN